MTEWGPRSADTMCDDGTTVTLRPEEVERFKNDPEYFDRVRHMLENSMNVSPKICGCEARDAGC